MAWLMFALCTVAIVYSGTKLSLYGDVIAEKTGMGRTWIGVVLMASATSLPELVTGISSVAIHDLPDIAAGDVLGSCMFNLAILALLDTRRNASPISAIAHHGHVLTAAFGVLLLGIVTICILAGNRIPALGWIGSYSGVLVLIYVAAMRLVSRYEKTRVAEYLSDTAEALQYGDTSPRRAYAGFALNGLVIVAAAAYLPHVGDEIARITGLGGTFVGSVFIAFSTSLPEVVVSRAALRLGAVDMAVGNILGSNLFNMAILAADDVFFRKGPLLSHIAQAHAVTAVAAMAMTAVVTIGLIYRPKKRVLMFSPDSAAVVLLYALASLLLFAMR